MTYKETLLFYGSDYQIAKHLGLSPTTPKHWRRIGYIPIPMQIKIEEDTKGILKAAIGKHAESQFWTN